MVVVVVVAALSEHGLVYSSTDPKAMKLAMPGSTWASELTLKTSVSWTIRQTWALEGTSVL